MAPEKELVTALEPDHRSADPSSAPPQVSVVTPTYNPGRYLRETVESVRAQTFAAWELVLIDDGSTDGTLDLSEEYARADPRIRLARGTHAGGAEARNRGLKHTDPRSPYVIFLDHDDTWEPETLERLVRALEEQPTAVAAHGLARAVDADGGTIEGDDLEAGMRAREELTETGDVRPLPWSAATTFGAVLVRNWIVTPGTCLIRRSTIEKVGVFEPSTSPADDWDLNIRLARHGEVRIVDAVVLNWRRHAGALSNNSRRWRWVCRAVRRRAVANRGNTPSQRRTALRAVQLDARSSVRLTAADLRHGRIAHAGLELFYATLVYIDYARLRFVRR